MHSLGMLGTEFQDLLTHYQLQNPVVTQMNQHKKKKKKKKKKKIIN